MTVGDLIEELEAYPAELMVVVRGYEGGVDEIDNVSRVRLHLNKNVAWYYGKHETVLESEPCHCEAVHIG